MSDRSWVKINRAPVLTLWAAVVANRLVFNWDESLTLGKCVAGLNAQSKGRRLGIFKPSEESAKKRREQLKQGEILTVDLLNRAVPAKRTEDGLRGLNKNRIVSSESVRSYLEKKFGDDLDDVKDAMREAAKSVSKHDLQESAYEMYSHFRPTIPSGKKGWGAEGRLYFSKIERAANEAD